MAIVDGKVSNPYAGGPEFDGTDVGEQAHIFAWQLEQAFLKRPGRSAQGNAGRVGDITADAIEAASLPLLRHAGYLALIDAGQVVMADSVEVLRQDRGLENIAADDPRLSA